MAEGTAGSSANHIVLVGEMAVEGCVSNPIVADDEDTSSGSDFE